MVKVTGVKPLTQKLHRLRKETGPKLMTMMGKAADLIVAEQKRLAPVRTGAMRNTIGWTFGDPPADAKFKIQSRSINATRITIFAGDFTVYYAHMVEWGTQSMRAQPFFYSGYRIMRRKAKTMIQKEVFAEVRKIAKA